MHVSRVSLLFKLLPLYVGTAFLFIGPQVLAQLRNPAIVAANTRYIERIQSSKNSKLVKGRPSRIIVPRLHLDLSITAGSYDRNNQSWTLSDDKAHYAVMTTLANNRRGNTLIYGHDTAAVFQKTDHLVENDLLIIETANHHRFEYYFANSETVSPRDTRVLSKQSNTPEVTLLTCSGEFYQFRRLMVFKFLKVS